MSVVIRTYAGRSGAPDRLRRLRHTWELLALLTRRELKLRYQDTVLGFAWSVIKPLLLGLVLYFALAQVLKIQITEYEHYHLFLLAALFPWTWFQTSVLLSAPAFANNANLLKKVYFPRFVLPWATVVNNLVHFLLSLPVLMLLMLVSGVTPGWSWLAGVPYLVLLQLMLLAGVTLAVASLDVFFRDLEHLVEVFLGLLFYATPILYSLDLVPDRFRPLILLNPLAPLMEGWRDLLLKDEFPGLALWPAVAASVLSLVLGVVIFRWLQGRFEDAL
jgi:ABC-type polysaccharide/polyol phosphate export permease